VNRLFIYKLIHFKTNHSHTGLRLSMQWPSISHLSVFYCNSGNNHPLQPYMYIQLCLT